MVLLYNGGIEPYYIRHEERIAQMILMDCPRASVVEVSDIPVDTDRGEGGFGSTGL
jgi:dUTP pyrophosphatase